MTLKAEDVKLLAAGRWIGIHRSVCGLTDHQLNPKTHGPCPRCGGADRFRAMDDVGETGALFCNQCFSTRNGDGFDAIQWLKGCTFAGALKLVSEFLGNHSSQGNGHHKPTVTPVATLERKPVVAIESHFLKFLQAKGRDSIDSLAGELGVSVQSLQALGVGFNPEESVWTFPERTADGIVSGLNRRYPTGEKKMMHGHKRGLYFADNWRELAGPVLIPEGGSDTAAAFTLGLAAIGRPSAIVPRDVLPELVTMLQSVPVDRGIIVVGENDQDHMQDHMPWPGKEGALRTAGELSKALGRSIPYALPPNTTKDLRTWLKSNPAATAHDFVDALTVVQDPEKPNEAAAESSLVFHDAWEAAFKPRPMRECIIEGMLRREEVGNVIASTKTGKSWFALQLLMCVATGRDWLGRRVAGGNVLLIDNELHEETIENRIAAVRDRMDIRHDTPHHDFHYVACRGDFVSLQDLIEQIPKKYPPGSHNLITIDAKYRLFGNGLEENSNDDQTTFHNMIDKFAKEMNCPILLIHHATKGDQSGKAVTDIGSGGGSQSRAVDLHMTIRPHQQPGLAVLDAAVRSFAPVEPVTLRWNWPLWSVDLDTEPALPKSAKDGDSIAVMQARILKHLSNEWQSVSSLADRCSTQKGRPPFVTILDDLETEKLIERREDFVPKNTKRPTSGIRFSSDKTTSDTVGGSLSEVSG